MEMFDWTIETNDKPGLGLSLWQSGNQVAVACGKEIIATITFTEDGSRFVIESTKSLISITPEEKNIRVTTPR